MSTIFKEINSSGDSETHIGNRYENHYHDRKTLQNQEAIDVKFREAAKAGDTAAMAKWYKKGAGLDCIDDHGRTPLFLAAFHDKGAVVVWLLNEGADLDIAPLQSGKPFAEAAQNLRESALIGFLECDRNPPSDHYEAFAQTGSAFMSNIPPHSKQRRVLSILYNAKRMEDSTLLAAEILADRCASVEVLYALNHGITDNKLPSTQAKSDKMLSILEDNIVDECPLYD